MGLNRLKAKIGTVRTDSLHYRVTGFLFERKLETLDNAWTYWGLVAASTVLVPLIFVALGIFYVFFGLFFFVAWFCGYTYCGVKAANTMMQTAADKKGVFPYRYSPRGDRYRRFAPWQIGTPFLATGLCYGLTKIVVEHPAGTLRCLTSAAIMAVVFGILTALYFVLKLLKHGIKKFARRASINLTIVS